jgi:predicted Abi (CAAX) family protease
MADYDDANRAFLQALMARGTMTFKQGQKVLAAIFTVKEGQFAFLRSNPANRHKNKKHSLSMLHKQILIHISKQLMISSLFSNME